MIFPNTLVSLKLRTGMIYFCLQGKGVCGAAVLPKFLFDISDFTKLYVSFCGDFLHHTVCEF